MRLEYGFDHRKPENFRVIRSSKLKPTLCQSDWLWQFWNSAWRNWSLHFCVIRFKRL